MLTFPSTWNGLQLGASLQVSEYEELGLVDSPLYERLISLRTGHQGPGIPRLHKPTLVALLLHRYITYASESATHGEVTGDLERLLLAVGVEGRINTEYPFWRLRADGFWTIDGADQLERVMNNSGDVRPVDLTSAHRGLWAPSALAELRANGGQRYLDAVLNAYFSPDQRAGLLAALPGGGRHAPTRSVISPVLNVWLGRDTADNAAFARQTRTWGTKHQPVQAANSCRYVLFGSNFVNGGTGGGNPRVDEADWVDGGRADLTLALLDSAVYSSDAPHWPDEITAASVLYPHRFGFTEVCSVDAFELSQLGDEGVHELRRASIGNRLCVSNIDVLPILAAAGLSADPVTSTIDLSHTPGQEHADARGPRSDDPKLRHAVEKHAEALAIAHMKMQGWVDIKTLGKPYDLVCNNGAAEKHVEVKGSTGAGTSVTYTPNEVEHFRRCPHGGDLIVVRNIRVDRTTYEASGGDLLHLPNYRAPAEHLVAAEWTGRVVGWD